jgi:uncharacterized membrane protein
VEDLVSRWAIQLALFIDFGAVLLVGLSAIDAFIHSFIAFFKRDSQQHHIYRPIRWLFGRRLTLALELLIASDIVRTAISPSWNDLGQLGAIVVLRELINFTLNRDIKESAIDKTERAT